MGWIKFLSALQPTAKSQVMVNNHLTSDIRLSRGVPHGVCRHDYMITLKMDIMLDGYGLLLFIKMLRTFPFNEAFESLPEI